MKKALILSGVAWNTTLQRHHKIALWLKQLGYEVYFVESIPSSSFTIKKVFNKLSSKFIKSSRIKNKREVNVINNNFLPPNFIFNYINKNKAKRMLKKIGNDFEIIVNYLPIYTTNVIIKNSKYNKLIYDCVRDFENWGGYPSSVKKYEKWLKENSNFIMTDSFYLTNKFNGIQFLPSISNKQLNIFKKNTKKVQEIRSIVYFGQIDTHIDKKVLELVSQKYDLHIIGNSKINLDFKFYDHGFISNKEELARELIKYDAIIIPYTGNMDGVIPAKFMESLASNKPVFISSFYDSEKLKEYCYVYHDLDELMQYLAGYKSNIKKSPIDLINNNTEELQFNKFRELLK